MGPAVRSPAPRFDGWLPIRFFWHEGEPRVDWCHFGDRALSEPFFRDSVEVALRQPFNEAFRRDTPASDLREWRCASPGIEPTAFVQHASRCGSTLVAQMLAATGEHIVVSEPPALDSVLRAHRMVGSVAEGAQVEWLRGLVSALAQPRRGERAFVVKLDAWHIFELHTLRAAFPATPWIYLYRDPLEIAVSQVRERGSYMIPGVLGPTFDLFAPGEALRMPAEEFIARVLGRMLEAAGDGCARAGGVPMHYSELPQALWTWAAPLFGVEQRSRQAMQGATRWNAKRPQLEFEADGEAKRREATPALRAAVERWAAPAYARLEAMRDSARAHRAHALGEASR